MELLETQMARHAKLRASARRWGVDTEHAVEHFLRTHDRFLNFAVYGLFYGSFWVAMGLAWVFELNQAWVWSIVIVMFILLLRIEKVLARRERELVDRLIAPAAAVPEVAPLEARATATIRRHSAPSA